MCLTLSFVYHKSLIITCNDLLCVHMLPKCLLFIEIVDSILVLFDIKIGQNCGAVVSVFRLDNILC